MESDRPKIFKFEPKSYFIAENTFLDIQHNDYCSFMKAHTYYDTSHKGKHIHSSFIHYTGVKYPSPRRSQIVQTQAGARWLQLFFWPSLEPPSHLSQNINDTTVLSTSFFKFHSFIPFNLYNLQSYSNLSSLRLHAIHIMFQQQILCTLQFISLQFQHTTLHIKISPSVHNPSQKE